MLSTIMLVSAVLASLAAGVLMAHAVCVGLFRVFRLHSQQVAARRLSAVQLRVAGN